MYNVYAWFLNTFLLYTLTVVIGPCSRGRERNVIKLTKMYVTHPHTHTYLCSLRILFSLSLCLVCVWLFSCTFLALLFKKWIDVRLKEELSCEVCCFFFSHWIYKVLKIVRWNNSRWCECVRERERRLHWHETPPDNSQHWHHRFQFCFIPLLYHFNSFRISLFYFSLSLSKRKQKETAHCWNLCLWLFTYLCWIYLLGLCIAFDGELRNRLCAMHPSCWKCDQIHKFIYAAMINST